MMETSFVTVFETSRYLGPSVIMGLVFLGAGIVFASATLRGKNNEQQSAAGRRKAIKTVAGVFCAAGAVMMISGVLKARDYTNILESGGCEVLSGEVRVISRKSKGGHGGSDTLRIGNRELRCTMAHGQRLSDGMFRDGDFVRVHLSRGELLKVEIRR